jgi:hypothetical protein
MRFSSKEDIDAPIDRVFAMLAEFEAYERSAIRRGIEVRRVDDRVAPADGLQWDVKFQMRGKTRDMQLKMARFDPPNAMHVHTDTLGLDGMFTIELLALSPRRTRMAVVLNLSPKTLSARLLVQSLKLAKSNLSRRFKLKVADYAKGMEERHSRTA